jgi:Big-like domain-containing protein
MKSKLGSLALSVLPLIFVALELAVPARAQGAPAQSAQSNLTVTYPTGFAVSIPVSQISQPALPTVQTIIPLRLRPLAGGGALAPSVQDQALQTQAGELLELEDDGGKPRFPGVGANGWAPPDANLAVGPNDIVQIVNVEYAVYNKNGTIFTGYPKAITSVFSALVGQTGAQECAGAAGTDPIVQYDRAADRWLISQMAAADSNFSAPYYECIAVSQTNDPTGAYNLYAYPFGTNMNDYPKLGVWPTTTNSAYTATYNLFAGGGPFVGAALCAYDRAAMLSGAASPASVCFTINASPLINDGGFLPSDLDGSTPPPDGTPVSFLNFQPLTLSSLRLYQFVPNFANPGSSTLSAPIDIGVASFSEACGGGTCIPQAGTSQHLDSLGDRLMYRLAYRNFGDHDALVVNHSVAAGSSVGVRWYELRRSPPTGAFTLYQQGTFAPADSTYRWMGSAAMDHAGDIAIGYSASSSSLFPAIRYTGRTPADAQGTMRAEISLLEGTGSQTAGLSRWGDYTALRIDPSDDCTFWYTNEYQPSNGTFNWATFIGSFKFMGCGQSLVPTTTTLSATPGSSTYGNSVTFTATVAHTSGTGAPTGTVTFSDGGTNLGTGTLDASGNTTFTTSTLSAGSRSITATYGGDSAFGGSASTPLAYAVAMAGTSTSVSSNNSSPVYGQSVTFTATVSPSAATGTVQFFDGATSLGTGTLSGGRASVSTSTLAAGSHSITGTYNGNSNYNASTSGNVSLTVSQAASTTSLASNVNPSISGQSVTFTATVLPSVATGTVQFVDGSNSLGTATLSGGRASVSTSSLAVGSHSITATYGGDANDTGSASSTLTQTVNPAPAGDFSLSATPASRTVVQGNSTTYTATVSAVNGFAGTVSFSASGLPTGATFSFTPTSVNTSGSSTMMVTTASTTPAGSYTLMITGTSGSLIHSTTVTLVVTSASSGNFSLSASPTSRTITAGNSTNYTATVTPTGGFTGSVTLSVSGLPSGANPTFSTNPITGGSGNSTISVTTSTGTPTGSYPLTITGTTSTSPSITHSTIVTLVVNSFSISASPPSQTVMRGNSTNYTVTVASINGFNAPVALRVRGLPLNSSASFNPSSVTGQGISTMTVSTNTSTSTGTFSLRIRGTSGSATHSTTVQLVVQ